MTAKPDLTLDDLVLEIAEAHQMTVHRVSVWRTLRSLGMVPPGLVQDRQNAVTAQAMTNCPQALPELSGN